MGTMVKYCTALKVKGFRIRVMSVLNLKETKSQKQLNITKVLGMKQPDMPEITQICAKGVQTFSVKTFHFTQLLAMLSNRDV